MGYCITEGVPLLSGAGKAAVSISLETDLSKSSLSMVGERKSLLFRAVFNSSPKIYYTQLSDILYSESRLAVRGPDSEK